MTRRSPSLLHRHDVGMKLIELVLFIVVLYRASAALLAILSVVFLLFGLLARFPWRTYRRRSLVGVFFIALLYLLSRGYFIEGTPSLLSGFSQEGLVSGALLAWRFLLIVFLGLLFFSTTNLMEIPRALYAPLKAIPLIPSAEVAIATALTATFIPLVLQKARESQLAMRSRALSEIRHPFRTMRILSLSLMERILFKAEDLSCAMEARGFDGENIPPKPRARRGDWIILLVTIIGLCTIELWLR